MGATLIPQIPGGTTHCTNKQLTLVIYPLDPYVPCLLRVFSLAVPPTARISLLILSWAWSIDWPHNPIWINNRLANHPLYQSPIPGWSCLIIGWSIIPFINQPEFPQWTPSGTLRGSNCGDGRSSKARIWSILRHKPLHWAAKTIGWWVIAGGSLPWKWGMINDHPMGGLEMTIWRADPATSCRGAQGFRTLNDVFAPRNQNHSFWIYAFAVTLCGTCRIWDSGSIFVATLKRALARIETMKSRSLMSPTKCLVLTCFDFEVQFLWHFWCEDMRSTKLAWRSCRNSLRSRDLAMHGPCKICTFNYRDLDKDSRCKVTGTSPFKSSCAEI